MDGLSMPRPVPAFEPSRKPAFAMLDDAVRQFGPRPAIDFLGRRWSYAQLGEVTGRAAAGLQKLGVRPGVNVGALPAQQPVFHHHVLRHFAGRRHGGEFQPAVYAGGD